MSVITHPPPAVKPDDDPLIAALECPATGEKLRHQANTLVGVAGDRRLDIEEIVQNTKLRALEIRDRYDPERGEPGAWLYKILSYVVKEEIARTRKLPTQQPRDQEIWEQMSPCRPSPEFDQSESRFLAERYMSRLKATDRAIVKLFFFEDRDHREIASQLNLSYDNVRMKFSRAMRYMKGCAANEGEGQS